MKFTFAQLCFLAIFWCAFSFSSCQSSTDSNTSTATTTDATPKINRVLSTAEFASLLQQKPNAQLLDVRTAEEVQGGLIEGATHYDFYADDFQEKLGSIDPNKPVFVYCKSGGRSGKASRILEKMGCLEIYDLQGGYTAWKAQH